MDDKIYVEIQWEEDGGWRKDISRSLASIHFQVMGARAQEKSLCCPRKVTDWSKQHEVLGFFLDTDELTISLPIRKIKELKEKLAQWT